MARGANRHLIGEPLEHPDFATPALVVDLDLLRRNIARMAELASERGRLLRPHAKAHKSGIVARMQIEAGAAGICCATVAEAEAMAAAGIGGILVTTPIVTPAYVARLAYAREKVDSLMMVVDSQTGVDLIAAMARPARPIDVLVDIDMGLGRDGVVDAGDAVALARRASSTPGLRYAGVQAYYGHLQHVPALADRLDRIAEQWRRLAPILDRLAAEGLAAGIVSGGGTGTHHLDLEHGPFTELQPGSYIFMDRQYGDVEIVPGGVCFDRSLSIAARVVSNVQPDRVIIDAGTKALSTDAGPAPVAGGAPADATYQFLGDEHGALRIAAGEPRPALGALVTLVAPHCDPTVNLYDEFHVVSNGRLVDIWPIEARGH